MKKPKLHPKSQFHLVVSANYDLWPKDRALLCLGQWCTPLREKNLWESFDLTYAQPFVPKNFFQQVNEVEKLKHFEEELLKTLASVLNQIHGQTLTTRCWRILLGNWLHRYITVFFNRYHTLANCLSQNDVKGVTFHKIGSYSLATRHSDEFVHACNDPTWNAELWHALWLKMGFDEEIIQQQKEPNSICFRMHDSYNETLVGKTICRISSLFNRHSNLMIITPYLPKHFQIKFWLQQFSFPQIWSKRRKPIVSQESSNMREKLKKELITKTKSKFQTTCVDLLCDVIPICYLEGFDEVKANATALGFPKNPEVIFTSNNFDTDEEFKSWVVDKLKKGSKYVIGQHGSNYGVDNLESPFVEEITADRFITWGAHTPYPNSKGGFIFTFPVEGMLRQNKKGNILLVQLAPPFHGYHYDAHYEYSIYRSKLETFYKELPSTIRRDLAIRLPVLSATSGWMDDERWREIDPMIKIDNFDRSFAKAVSESRLVIFTYFSTGFLECMCQGVPVICFWRHNIESFSPEVQPLFELLKVNGILHEMPQNAAKHIDAINFNIEEWWNSVNLVSCRKKFTEQLARLSENPNKQLLNMLTFEKG